MKKNITGVALLMAVTAIIVFFVFRPFLLNPNSFLFSKSPEAIKSYYNFSYTLKYGFNDMKHDGINYPYGEHIQMDSSHPFHLFILSAVDNILPVSKYGVGLINLSVILSFFVTAFFLFLLLRRYEMPAWYSVIISLIVLFLSPQLARLSGSFELAYLFFIPMWWYFLLKVRDGEKRWIWSLLLIITGVIGGLTSFWLLAIYVLFIFGLILGDCWIDRKNLKPILKREVLFFCYAVVPILIVRGILFATDWVGDRPQNMDGFFDNTANIFSIFLPFDWFVQMVSAYTYSQLNISIDTKANIGLPSIGFAAVLLSLILYRFYTRKNIAALFPNKEFNPFLISSFLILIFSMGFPFSWGLGFLVKIIPPLKILGFIGRFAWVFFYVFTVYAAINIFLYYQKLKEEGNVKKSIWLMVICLALWTTDAVFNSVEHLSNTWNNNDRLESDGSEFMKRFDAMGRKPSDFQSILFAPFAGASADKMEFGRGADAFIEAMKLSYHSQLPIIECFSPRMSASQAFSSIQIFSDSCIRKTRLNDMNSKPLLLMTMNSGLSDNEKNLLQNSKTLWNDQWLTLSEVSPGVFNQQYENWKNWALETKTSLVGNAEIKSDTLTNVLFYKNFDNELSNHVFAGLGALYKNKGTAEIFNEDFASRGIYGEYELSFWVYINMKSPGMPEISLEEIDKYDFPINVTKLNVSSEHNVYKQWVRVRQKIDIKPGMRYRLIAVGKNISIDNLLLKPIDSNVYVLTSDRKELMNNYVID